MEKRLNWGIQGESSTPMRKLYQFETSYGMTVPTIQSDIALNQHGARDYEIFFGEKAAFDTPKPVELNEKNLPNPKSPFQKNKVSIKLLFLPK